MFRFLAVVLLLSFRGCETCPASDVVFNGFTDKNGTPMNRTASLTLLNQPIYNGVGLTYDATGTYPMTNFTVTVSNLAGGNYALSLAGLNRILGLAVPNDTNTYQFMQLVTNQLPTLSTTLLINYQFDTNFFIIVSNGVVTLNTNLLGVGNTNAVTNNQPSVTFGKNYSILATLSSVPDHQTIIQSFDGGINLQIDNSTDPGWHFTGDIVTDAGVTATNFIGNGHLLTHLQAANLDGVVPTNNLPMSQLGGGSGTYDYNSLSNTPTLGNAASANTNAMKVLAATNADYATDLGTNAFDRQWNRNSATGAVASATTAGTATNIYGGFGTYIVKTNGWYAPSGIWHSETNAGNSLQHALDYSSIFNTNDAFFTYLTGTNMWFDGVDYTLPYYHVDLIQLPYPMGGKFEIAAGDYYRPQGFTISNNLQTGSWCLIGTGAGTRLIGDTNVISPAIVYFDNDIPAALKIELDSLTFLSKTNQCGLQVNLYLSAQDTYVHDCYFSMYNWWNFALDHGMPFEDARYITEPPGMIGLELDGMMGNGTARKNRFYGLAIGMIAGGESTYVEENSFYSMSEWNGHLTNLWSTTNQLYIPCVPGSEAYALSHLQGAELSFGCALVINPTPKSWVSRNFFFDGGHSIYIGKSGATTVADTHIIENSFQEFPVSGGGTILYWTNNYSNVNSPKFINNKFRTAGNSQVGTINWNGTSFPISTNIVTLSPVINITDDVTEDSSGIVHATGFAGSGIGLNLGGFTGTATNGFGTAVTNRQVMVNGIVTTNIPHQ